MLSDFTRSSDISNLLRPRQVGAGMYKVGLANSFVVGIMLLFAIYPDAKWICPEYSGYLSGFDISTFLQNYLALAYFISICYFLLLILLLLGWLKTPGRTSCVEPLDFSPLPQVSIILPVRNEEKNILSILNCLSKQDYSENNYEIIVVDDFSTDKTFELAQQTNISNMKLVRLSRVLGRTGKKNAITEGVTHASGTLIITTDADCTMNDNWLSSIISFYMEKKSKMIVAPVLLKEKRNGRMEDWNNGSGFPIFHSSNLPTFQPSIFTPFHQLFQSQEMTLLTTCACASLYYHIPLLCSGANLIYERDAFLSVGGYKGTPDTPTGDDIFLMLKIHKKFPSSVHYLKSREAVVFTNQESSWSDVLNQRRRWASKNFLYGWNHITWVALLVFLTNLFIFLSSVLSVINSKFVPALITTLLVKIIADYMLLHSASSFFRRKTYLFIFLLASLLYPFYVCIIGFSLPFRNYSWKGRKG